MTLTWPLPDIVFDRYVHLQIDELAMVIESLAQFISCLNESSVAQVKWMPPLASDDEADVETHLRI